MRGVLRTTHIGRIDRDPIRKRAADWDGEMSPEPSAPPTPQAPNALNWFRWPRAVSYNVLQILIISCR